MIANHTQPAPPSYDHVAESDSDDSAPPPPPASPVETFTDHDIIHGVLDTEPAQPVKKWRLLKKEAEHALLPQQEPESEHNPSMNDENIPSNGDSHLIEQGVFQNNNHNSRRLCEEYGEIEDSTSSFVPRVNHSENPNSTKRKRIFQIAIIGGIALLVLITILTAGGRSGDASLAESEGVTNDGGSNDDGVDNKNMDTLAGKFILDNPKIPDSIKTNFKDPESTASQALDWVLNDPANGEYPFDAEGTFENVLAKIDLTQRVALATIAKSMNVNPDNNNWMSDEDVCDWEGIKCGSPDAAGVEQVAHNIITEITLNGGGTEGSFKMEGTIPAEIALLPDLAKLSFWNNKLSGPIPSELGSMPSLVYIDFDDNDLTGQIPPEICTDKLQEIYLSKNELTGPIPTTVGQMTNVETIWLHNNGLEGGIPDEMRYLQNLRELLLDSNPIFDGLDDGTFPEFLKGLGRLETLTIRNVLMGGSFPQIEYGDFPNLKVLKLDDNLLTGEISEKGIGNLASLVELSLARNEGLEGDLPLDIGELKSLEMLDLSNCSFQNDIPMEIGFAERLKFVYLKGNKLKGKVPGSFYMLKDLQELEVHDNVNIVGVHEDVCWLRAEEDTLTKLLVDCGVECDCCTNVC